MMDGTHDVSACDPSLIELESWIEAARQGDREALGQALSSVRDYLLLVANEGLEPALQGQGERFRPGAGDLLCGRSEAWRVFADARRANGGTGCGAS